MGYIMNFFIPFIIIHFGCTFLYVVFGTLFGFGLLGVWILADKSKKPQFEEGLEECPNLPYEVLKELWNERDPSIDYELKEGEYVEMLSRRCL